MEALILAAGLGTRLRPLTDCRPKALVEIDGQTLLEIAIRRVAEAGVKRCVVNVHYFGDMLMQHVLVPLLKREHSNIIQRATILEDGKLTPPFAYLEPFAKGDK